MLDKANFLIHKITDTNEIFVVNPAQTGQYTESHVSNANN